MDYRLERDEAAIGFVLRGSVRALASTRKHDQA